MKPPFDTTPMILYPEGLAESVWPKNGRHFSLEELQAIVGGYIELVPIVVEEHGVQTELHMYVNENGKLEPSPVNSLATMLYHNARMTPDFVVGTVLVTPPKYIARDEEEDCA